MSSFGMFIYGLIMGFIGAIVGIIVYRKIEQDNYTSDWKENH